MHPPVLPHSCHSASLLSISAADCSVIPPRAGQTQSLRLVSGYISRLTPQSFDLATPPHPWIFLKLVHLSRPLVTMVGWWPCLLYGRIFRWWSQWLWRRRCATRGSPVRATDECPQCRASNALTHLSSAARRMWPAENDDSRTNAVGLISFQHHRVATSQRGVKEWSTACPRFNGGLSSKRGRQLSVLCWQRLGIALRGRRRRRIQLHPSRGLLRASFDVYARPLTRSCSSPAAVHVRRTHGSGNQSQARSASRACCQSRRSCAQERNTRAIGQPCGTAVSNAL